MFFFSHKNALIFFCTIILCATIHGKIKIIISRKGLHINAFCTEILHLITLEEDKHKAYHTEHSNFKPWIRADSIGWWNFSIIGGQHWSHYTQATYRHKPTTRSVALDPVVVIATTEHSHSNHGSCPTWTSWDSWTTWKSCVIWMNWTSGISGIGRTSWTGWISWMSCIGWISWTGLITRISWNAVNRWGGATSEHCRTFRTVGRYQSGAVRTADVVILNVVGASCNAPMLAVVAVAALVIADSSVAQAGSAIVGRPLVPASTRSTSSVRMTAKHLRALRHRDTSTNTIRCILRARESWPKSASGS